MRCEGVCGELALTDAEERDSAMRETVQDGPFPLPSVPRASASVSADLGWGLLWISKLLGLGR